MWFKKKNKKSAQTVNDAPVLTKKDAAAKIEEYNKSISAGKDSIKSEMKAFEIAAENLKSSGKKIKKVKDAFSAKVSKRTIRKHGDKLDAYNDSLDEYVRIVSHINWLLNTVSSCYEATARLNEEVGNVSKARKIRVEAQKYFADINYKKAKLEKMTDGIVMPVATYVR